MTIIKPVRLIQLKTQASFLLRILRTANADSNYAAQRFRIIPPFADRSNQWLIENSHAIRLKHAFHVIAAEHGYETWGSLKNDVIEKDFLYRSSHVGFVHAWFSDAQQAEQYLMKHGGYLLNFWKDYIICGDEYITALVLIHYTECWQRIGFNWVKPLDRKAYDFLKACATEIYLKLN